MPDPAQLAALAAIHRRGSFDLAAADLHVTPSAISQRLKALEETIGTLLIRRGQPCTATPTGLRLIRHHDEVALLTRQLARDLPPLPSGLPSGPVPLRIAVNADSLATWVIPALAATPDFLFDLVIDDQDAAHDLLRSAEVMAAITGQPGPMQGCDSIPLGALRYRATASPAFVARWFPTGITASAARHAPALVYSAKDRLQSRWLAARIGAEVPFPSQRIASTHGFVDAAIAGLGWGMNPETLAAPHIAAGRLIDLSPDAPLDVPLHWQVTRLAAPALRPLTTALRHEAARVLVPPA